MPVDDRQRWRETSLGRLSFVVVGLIAVAVGLDAFSRDANAAYLWAAAGVLVGVLTAGISRRLSRSGIRHEGSTLRRFAFTTVAVTTVLAAQLGGALGYALLFAGGFLVAAGLLLPASSFRTWSEIRGHRK